MSTDGWIKMSERKPDKFPVWYWNPEFNEPFLYEDETFAPGNYSHWQPAVLPAPPKKALTQRDRDLEAHDNWRKAAGLPCWFDDTYPAWHAALAYRDKQNAGDLKDVSTLLLWDKSPTESAPILASLRRRCGLDT